MAVKLEVGPPGFPKRLRRVIKDGEEMLHPSEEVAK